MGAPPLAGILSKHAPPPPGGEQFLQIRTYLAEYPSLSLSLSISSPGRDPRSGKALSYDIYLPTRVSDAPADPPGSRIFSASMGRALGASLGPPPLPPLPQPPPLLQPPRHLVATTAVT